VSGIPDTPQPYQAEQNTCFGASRSDLPFGSDLRNRLIVRRYSVE